VEQLPEVLECYFVTGEFDYMIKIITDNTESLELLLHTVKSIPGVHRTLTSVVMSTVKTSHPYQCGDVYRQVRGFCGSRAADGQVAPIKTAVWEEIPESGSFSLTRPAN
jgi:hypothetical protein